MNKYEIRTQKKKDSIIQAALELFRDKGYTNVSINEIASHSGVSSVSIYNYFGNKEGVIKECARFLMQETTQIVNDLLLENISFKEKLLRALSICAEKPHQLLEEYFSQEALHDTVFVDLYKESANEIRRDILQVFIESGKQEGTIDASISTETVMEFLDIAASIQANWETKEDHQTKTAEIGKLILYGLIGR
ncbi:TetR/AcrR family transcriptional regulator [Peribacillus muralis]|uniref:TetR/AcrR family transcriptional regulator n=1 Tax=Peribacillus muralis TaxID=264697 RepID=UPI003670BF27